MYKINVNNNYEAEVNPVELNWDLLEIRDGKFHIIRTLLLQLWGLHQRWNPAR